MSVEPDRVLQANSFPEAAVAFDAMPLRQMNDVPSLDRAGRWDRAGDAEAAPGRLFGDGVRPLRIEAALFDAVLAGWRRAHGGRHLSEGTKRSREVTVKRFVTTSAGGGGSGSRWMLMSGSRISARAGAEGGLDAAGLSGALRGFGSLAAQRDAVLFKTIYAWGLCRHEAARLGVRDFSRNPSQAAFGRYGRWEGATGRPCAVGRRGGAGC